MAYIDYKYDFLNSIFFDVDIVTHVGNYMTFISVSFVDRPRKFIIAKLSNVSDEVIRAYADRKLSIIN